MSRPIWKGHISFGLVNVPVILHAAERRAGDLSFRMIDSRNSARVRYERVNEETGEEVPWDKIVKGYEYEDGNYVLMSEEELEHASPEMTRTIEIEQFVDLDDIDIRYFDRPYVLVPGNKGEKGYVLLREAIRDAGKVGIAKVVIRARQYLAALIPQGDALVLELLRYRSGTDRFERIRTAVQRSSEARSRAKGNRSGYQLDRRHDDEVERLEISRRVSRSTDETGAEESRLWSNRSDRRSRGRRNSDSADDQFHGRVQEECGARVEGSSEDRRPRQRPRPVVAGGVRERSAPVNSETACWMRDGMSLKEYKHKRNFKKTPEPAGGKGKAGKDRQYVIQKHAASRLHYDFRLEHDGTLKSWAVPKGPSLDPSVKSLAVQVEDHPLEYATFEGTIPEGEYGGGTVMVWDHGTWEPEEDADEGFKTGKLKFQLHGEKLHGSWALVRMGGRAGDGGKNWLLIKHRDDEAKSASKFDVVKREPLSVVTGRDLDEIASDADAVWTSKRQGGWHEERQGHRHKEDYKNKHRQAHR